MSASIVVAREASLALLDRELRSTLGAIPIIEIDADTLAAGRAEGNAICLDYLGAVDVPVERDVVLIRSRDGHPIKTIIHRPQRAAPDTPVLLHVHGGGMVMGVPEMLDRRNEVLASRYGCIIATPDYRKAPEFPGPVGAQDCHDVLRWIANGGVNSTGVRPKRVVAAGESGGGGIVASCALMDRDSGEHLIAALLLFAPMLDDRTGRDVAASGPYADFGWSASNNEFCWRAMNSRTSEIDHRTGFVSPARATDLSRLPPTFVAVGQLDLFMKESVEFAVRLSDAFVSVELHVYPGAPHGFGCAVHAAVAQRAWTDFETYLAKALDGKIV
jgi:acetyl esterase/lipase